MTGLSFIILSMFLATWYTTSAQKADGLVINLAGRQRMLSQKMSKELFLFIQSLQGSMKNIYQEAQDLNTSSTDYNRIKNFKSMDFLNL